MSSSAHSSLSTAHPSRDTSLPSSSASSTFENCNISCFRSPFASAFCNNPLISSNAGIQRQDLAFEDLHSEGHSMMIKEVTDMDAREGQKAYEDLHGVSQDIQETPELLQSSLDSMRAALLQAVEANPNKNGNGYLKAFQRAHFLVPTRVWDEGMLLKFLRCEEFHVDRAVQRYFRFFDFTNKTLGLDALLHDCRQEDLDKDDLDFLHTGGIMPLWEAQDRSGRIPYFVYTNRCRYKDPLNFVKVAYYMFMKVSRDNTAQQRGVVMVAWTLQDENESFVPPITPSFVYDTMHLLDAIPVRMASLHYCYQGREAHPLLEFGLLAGGRTARVRSRMWRGTITECAYSLMTFGLDVSRFPLETDGSLKLEAFNAWLDAQARAEETESKQVVGDLLPSSKDILLGRGHPFRSFPGNLALTKLVQESWSSYTSHGARKKDALYREILSCLPGRILHRQDSSSPWQVAPEKMSLTRISKSFRNKPTLEQYHNNKKKLW